MRKFKVWHKQLKKWLTDDEIFIVQDGAVYLIEERESGSIVYMYKEEITHNVDAVNFTGLTDRNGVEIYEGDIVLYNRNIGKTIDKYRYVVKYSIDKYILDHVFSEIEDGISWDMVEIVSNIYEHPHLLEGVK